MRVSSAFAVCLAISTVLTVLSASELHFVRKRLFHRRSEPSLSSLSATWKGSPSVQKGRISASAPCSPHCADRRNLTIAVLAPQNDSLPYALNKILPAIIYAASSIKVDPRFSAIANWTIDVLHQDTGCSSAQGPLAAFDFYSEGAADVFLGPLCPYVLAPVARYSTVWDIPILTSAGQIDNFDTKLPNYRLLTRMNGAYSQVGNILLQILQKFDWHVVGLLYHNFEDRTKGNSNCFFTLAAVFSKLGTRPYHRGFDEMSPRVDYKALLQEISLSARSEYMCMYMYNAKGKARTRRRRRRLDLCPETANAHANAIHACPR